MILPILLRPEKANDWAIVRHSQVEMGKTEAPSFTFLPSVGKLQNTAPSSTPPLFSLRLVIFHLKSALRSIILRFVGQRKKYFNFLGEETEVQ